jgi:hypothetical protein
VQEAKFSVHGQSLEQAATIEREESLAGLETMHD